MIGTNSILNRYSICRGSQNTSAFYIKHVMPERRAFGVKIPRQHTAVRRLKLPATSSHILAVCEHNFQPFVAPGVPVSTF